LISLTPFQINIFEDCLNSAKVNDFVKQFKLLFLRTLQILPK
jgi:hypothetical protein